MFRQRFLIAAVVAILGLVAPRRAGAEDRYFLLMFASQATPNVAQQSHTFALFVKVPTDARAQPESVTISWMPASLMIEPLRRDSVLGANLTLPRTLDWALSIRASVSMWGPFPIKKQLFDLAVAQAEKLASGQVQYIALDGQLRGKGASNCIHAVSDLDATQPMLDTGTSFGIEGSEKVLTHFEPFILPSRESNRWLVDRLGLNPLAIRFVNPDLTKP